MSGTSTLRWALYNGVYQPAVLVSAEEVPGLEIPVGATAAYLLGCDETVPIPDKDILDYNEEDQEKINHPDAQAGVEVARGILHGFSQGGADAMYGEEEEYATVGDFVDLPEDMEDDEGLQRRSKKEKKHKKKKHAEDGEDADEDEEEDAEARRLRKEQRKAEKKRAKREREDLTSAVAAYIEEKYGETSKSSSKPKTKNAEPTLADQWAELEGDYFSDDEDDENEAPEAAGSAPSRRRGGRGVMGNALAALNASGGSTGSEIPGIGAVSSVIHPYIGEIHYEFNKMKTEAETEGKLLSMQEGDLIRAVEQQLLRAQHMRYYLQLAADRHDGVPEARAAIETQLERLDEPFEVREVIARLLTKVTPPHSIFRDHATRERVRRAVARRTNTFQDGSVLALLEQMRSTDVAQREDAGDAIRRYTQQRIMQERVRAATRGGLERTGFVTAPKPFERWFRERDMMVVANAGSEAQKVKPTSYISQRFSRASIHLREHAEKKYESGTMRASGASSFLGMSHFASGGTIGTQSSLIDTGLPSAAVVGGGMSSSSPISAFLPQRPSAFNFHDLSVTAGTGLDAQTVVLGSGDATIQSASMMQGIPIAPGETSAMYEPSAAMSDVSSVAPSARTEAEASEYPFLFNGGGAARPHRSSRHRRGRSRSLRADGTEPERSASEGGESAYTSRATSASRAEEGTDAAAEGVQEPQSSVVAWRNAAKRCIREQLTLYCLGKGGKPAILPQEEVPEVAKTLLDRVMRAEAQRQGISMTVQTSRIQSEFTKTTEHKIKKSVDHYIQKHWVGRAPTTGVLGNGQKEQRAPVVADTPAYE